MVKGTGKEKSIELLFNIRSTNGISDNYTVHCIIHSNRKNSCYLEFISFNNKQITNWENLTFSSSLVSENNFKLFKLSIYV